LKNITIKYLTILLFVPNLLQAENEKQYTVEVGYHSNPTGDKVVEEVFLHKLLDNSQGIIETNQNDILYRWRLGVSRMITENDLSLGFLDASIGIRIRSNEKLFLYMGLQYAQYDTDYTVDRYMFTYVEPLFLTNLTEAVNLSIYYRFSERFWTSDHQDINLYGLRIGYKFF